MAIINSVLIGKGRGSVGNVTLRIAGGDTIASQKISKGAQKLERCLRCCAVSVWAI